MNTNYQGAVGVVIPIALVNPDGSPVDLSQAGTVVTLQFYSFGTNTLLWGKMATIDDGPNGLAHYTTASGDFGTLGDFFSLVQVTYTGYSNTFVGESWKIISQQQSSVTPGDLLEFMDLPASTAKPATTIQLYIDQADQQLLLEVPLLATNTSTQIIQFRLHCVRLAASIFYWMNSSEMNVNPELRLQKIKLWNEMYNNSVDKLNSALGNTATGESTVRRVENTSSADISPLASDYTP